MHCYGNVIVDLYFTCNYILRSTIVCRDAVLGYFSKAEIGQCKGWLNGCCYDQREATTTFHADILMFKDIGCI